MNVVDHRQLQAERLSKQLKADGWDVSEEQVYAVLSNHLWLTDDREARALFATYCLAAAAVTPIDWSSVIFDRPT